MHVYIHVHLNAVAVEEGYWYRVPRLFTKFKYEANAAAVTKWWALTGHQSSPYLGTN